MIYCITNQKGGVGKSTTSENLLSGLKSRGYKVLGIDLDHQRCLTSTFKGKTNGATSMPLLLNEATVEDAIQKTEECDLIAGSRSLAAADTASISQFCLRDALSSIKNKYDYIVIDTCPALGILTINALTAADEVIIPIQEDLYSIEGVKELVERTISKVKELSNPNLKISGLLLTMSEPRSILSKEIKALASKYAESIGTKVFKSTIRRSVIAREAQANHKSLFTYAPDTKITKDYESFITELIGDNK